jgi:hypothetical protein
LHGASHHDTSAFAVCTAQARIYSSAKSASQSGFAKTLHNSNAAPAWRIAFETTAK